MIEHVSNLGPGHMDQLHGVFHRKNCRLFKQDKLQKKKSKKEKKKKTGNILNIYNRKILTMFLTDTKYNKNEGNKTSFTNKGKYNVEKKMEVLWYFYK